ncbi:MAG TPA: aminopeptidase [Thermomicrobiales bacterium]|nr:aminopeptidase [Thermomicrobiales bacterium]
MSDPRFALWARTLVNYSVGVKPGDRVAITGGTAAEPLLRAIYRETIAAGGCPVLVPTFSGLAADLLQHGDDAQIQYISPVDAFAREEADVLIGVMAETNTKALSAVDPARQSLLAKARGRLLEATLRREAAGELRWTLTLFPTDAYAQDADLSTPDFTEFVLAACKLDGPDPAAAWRAQAAEQQRLIDWLAGKREIRLRGPDTDLRLTVAGRTWINADGTKNFPDGEIFTGPVEDATEGHVRFSFPVVTQGREIDDIRLRFAGGRVVDASAAKNEAFLIQTLDTDPGARVLGEFAFGTNFAIQRFSKNILFDEKIGGTVHMAVGSGYPETGNHNVSAVHWDMICDLREGGVVEVDGEPFLRNGAFVV